MNILDLIIKNENKISRSGIDYSIPSNSGDIYEFIKYHYRNNSFVNFDNPDKYFSNYHLYNYDKFDLDKHHLEDLKIYINKGDMKEEIKKDCGNCKLVYNAAKYIYELDNSDIHIPFYLEALKEGITSLSKCKDFESVNLYNKMIHKMKKILEEIYTEPERKSFKKLDDIFNDFLKEIYEIDGIDLPAKTYKNDDTIVPFNLERFNVLFDKYNKFLFFQEKYKDISLDSVRMSQAMRKVSFYITDLLEVIYHELLGFQKFLMNANDTIYSDLEEMIKFYMRNYYIFMDQDVEEYLREKLSANHAMAMNSNYLRHKREETIKENERILKETDTINYVKDLINTLGSKLTELYNESSTDGLLSIKDHLNQVDIRLKNVLKFYYYDVTDKTKSEIRSVYKSFQTLFDRVDSYIRSINFDKENNEDLYPLHFESLQHILLRSSNNPFILRKILKKFKDNKEKALFELKNNFLPSLDTILICESINDITELRVELTDNNLIDLCETITNLLYLGLGYNS